MSDQQTSGKGPGRPRNTEPSGPLGTHPMRQRIVEALIRNEPTRSIATWVTPPVSHVAVARLRKLVLREIEAARVLEKAKQMIAPASINPSNAVKPEKVAALAVAGSEHLSRIRNHQDRTSRLLDQAEANGDAGAVATLIRTDYQGIRLAAEIDQTLSQGPVMQTVNNTQVIVLPSFASDELEPAIDVPSEHVR